MSTPRIVLLGAIAGLAIGQSAHAGEVSLATLLIIGVATDPVVAGAGG